MSEIERAIELFEDEVRILYGHGNLSSPESIEAHELALKLLRAELSRQENAPLTMEDVVSEAYDRGYNLGYSDGYQDGTKGEETE